MQDLIGGESSHLVVESQVASDARPVLSVTRFFILAQKLRFINNRKLKENRSLPITENSNIMRRIFQ